jgi:hypothetical protein
MRLIKIVGAAVHAQEASSLRLAKRLTRDSLYNSSYRMHSYRTYFRTIFKPKRGMAVICRALLLLLLVRLYLFIVYSRDLS